MVDYWKANKEIQQQALDLVAKYHPDLALVSSEICIVFRDKASKSGGQVILGNSKKAQPLMNAVADADYKFILEIAADEWEETLDTQQREALLDHLLCACVVEEDPKSGVTKFKVRKPDIMAYRDNVERYGMWFPKPEGDADGNRGAAAEVDNLVDDLFGDKDKGSDEADSGDK